MSTTRPERPADDAPPAAEGLLTASQAHALLHDGPTVVYVLRRIAGRLAPTEITANVQRILGYTCEEALEADWWPAHVHADDRAAALARFAALGAGEELTHEYRFARKDGSFLWVLDRMRITEREAGAPVTVVGVWIDISERRQAELLLRESEERSLRLSQLYGALSECNLAIVRCASAEDLFPRVCRAAVIVGKMAMAWIGLTDEATGEVVPVASHGVGAGYLDGIRISVRGDDPFGRGPTGTSIRENRPFWVRDFRNDAATAQWHERGAPYGWMGSAAIPLTREGRAVGALTLYAWSSDAFDVDGCRLLVEMGADISFALDGFAREARRVQAEAQLKDSQSRYRALVEQAPVAVLVDRAHEIVLANAACLRLFRAQSEGQLLGRAPSELFHPDSLAGLGERTRSLREIGEGALCSEEKIVRLDGTIADVECNVAPFRIDGQNALHVVLTDVTERNRLQAQFLEAQKMEVVGRLAGGIAHDFNNLLTVINATADVAASALPPGNPARADFLQILEAGSIAAGLTRQLLAFSRKQVRAPVVLDAGVHVAGISKMIQRLLGEDVSLTFETQPALDGVLLDPGQLEQVLLNLAVNARDAMPEGGAVTIRTRNATIEPASFVVGGSRAARAYVVLTFADSGVGMSAEVRGRIFEPFFTTKELGKGTGLGLATVHDIVEQSGGFIRVSSDPGLGTSFELFFPSVSAAKARRPAVAEPPRRGAETILLVEDEPSVRELSARILRSLGYRVLPAAGAEQALAVAAAHDGPLHLLFTDVVMPGKSGPVLAEELVAARPGTPVLFTSGYADDARLEPSLLARRGQFLAKPYSIGELSRTLRAILDAPAR